MMCRNGLCGQDRVFGTGYCVDHQPKPTTFKDVLGYIFGAFIIYCLIGAGVGIISSASARAVEMTDGCIYRSILPFTNPGYLASCELARARFNVEQPVQYVPNEVKELK